MPHKFTIGQTVHFRPAGHDHSVAGLYVVTKRLPVKDGEFQYRIKQSHEHEPTRESDLAGTDLRACRLERPRRSLAWCVTRPAANNAPRFAIDNVQFHPAAGRTIDPASEPHVGRNDFQDLAASFSVPDQTSDRAARAHRA